MIAIDELKFDQNGLIPAIVVDAVSKQVLTLAYMNRESLKITMEKVMGGIFMPVRCKRRKTEFLSCILRGAMRFGSDKRFRRSW